MRVRKVQYQWVYEEDESEEESMRAGKVERREGENI